MPLSVARLGGGGRLDAQLRCGCAMAAAGTAERGMTTPQWALVWIESGAGTLMDGSGRSWELVPDTVFQRLPGRPLDVVRLAPTRWWYLALPAACHAAMRCVGLPGILRQAFPIRPIPGLAQRFRRCAGRLRDAPVDRLAGCLSELLALAVDLHAAGRADADLHAGPVARACRLIAADPLLPWTPAGLARRVGLGHHAFRKAFAATIGCGPATYRLRLRLERAQDLLAAGSLPVATVAARCGWGDPLQFTAVFRRHLGMPPRTWRRSRT